MKFVTSLAFSDPTQYCELARCAEAAGWDGLVVSDHVVHPEKITTPYPYTKDGAPRWQAPAPWPDPWVAVGAMSAVTQRIRFLTGIYVLPMRNPFSVAKAVGTAAVLSGGRVTLGVGVGWMREEFALMEQPFEQRGARTDEMIDVMRKLWRGGMVEHHGKHFDFARLQQSPAPAAPPPIYVGGVSPPALRRAARLGDGWMGTGQDPAEVPALLGRLRELREQAGRGDEPFETIVPLVTPPDVDVLRRLGDAGMTATTAWPFSYTLPPNAMLAEKRDSLLRFGETFIAKLR